VLDTGEDTGDKTGQFYRQWRAAEVRLTP